MTIQEIRNRLAIELRQGRRNPLQYNVGYFHGLGHGLLAQVPIGDFMPTFDQVNRITTMLDQRAC